MVIIGSFSNVLNDANNWYLESIQEYKKISIPNYLSLLQILYYYIFIIHLDKGIFGAVIATIIYYFQNFILSTFIVTFWIDKDK